MSNFSIKLDENKINKLKQAFKNDIKANPNEYIDTFIQKDNLTISIYKSQKVVFQGEDAFFYAQSFIDIKENRQAGSDEVGTGDYFGPVVIAASIVEEEDYPFIKENGITDSKQMTDEKIMKLGPIVENKFKHSILILDNEKYNKVHESNNMNQIKAKMHNQAYINLQNKGYDIPKEAYIDQFCPRSSYFEYLEDVKEIYRDVEFETKAESKYPAVAISSVLARYTFLKYMDEMNKAYNFEFPKGANELVDQKAQEFVKKYGQDKLYKVAKVHFKNTEKI